MDSDPPETKRRSRIWKVLSICTLILTLSIQRECQRQRSDAARVQQAQYSTIVYIPNPVTGRLWPYGDATVISKDSVSVKFRTRDGQIIEHHGTYRIQTERKEPPYSSWVPTVQTLPQTPPPLVASTPIATALATPSPPTPASHTTSSTPPIDPPPDYARALPTPVGVGTHSTQKTPTPALQKAPSTPLGVPSPQASRAASTSFNLDVPSHLSEEWISKAKCKHLGKRVIYYQGVVSDDEPELVRRSAIRIRGDVLLLDEDLVCVAADVMIPTNGSAWIKTIGNEVSTNVTSEIRARVTALKTPR